MNLDRVRWRCRPPKRAAGRLGWTGFLALFVSGPTVVIFAGEPLRTVDGAVNPLALVVPVLVTIFGAALAPLAVALVRRPSIAADHYALAVRPGVGRTLVLPWAQLTEVALVEVDEEPYLLIRCGPPVGRSGDWPRWWDQGHLRSARRGNGAITVYDLAVPMDDFQGTPVELLAELSRKIPPHVAIVNTLPPPEEGQPVQGPADDDGGEQVRRGDVAVGRAAVAASAAPAASTPLVVSAPLAISAPPAPVALPAPGVSAGTAPSGTAPSGTASAIPSALPGASDPPASWPPVSKPVEVDQTVEFSRVMPPPAGSAPVSTAQVVAAEPSGESGS